MRAQEKAAPACSATVAVLEIEPSGHRLQYVRHLIEAAGPDRSVLLTSEEAISSEEFRTHASSLDVATVVLPNGADRRTVLAAAVARASAVGARRLVIPDGDRYLVSLLALLLRRPFLRMEIRPLIMRTMVFNGPEGVRPATVVKPILAQLLQVFPQIRLAFLTDALGVVAHRRGYLGLRPLRDPVARAEEIDLRRPDWLPPAGSGSPLVGVFGVIGARKNLPLLVEALEHVPLMVVAVGGRLDQEVRTYLNTGIARELVDEGRIVVVDRILDSNEFAAALVAVDLVAVLHDNDAPSGILAEACLRSTPALVPRGGWLAQVVQVIGSGVAVPLSGAGVAEGIARLADDRQTYVEAARRHSVRLGTDHFTDGLLEG